MNDLIIFLIGIAVGIVVQVIYSVIEMFRCPEKMIDAAEQIIELKDYINRGY